MTFSEYLMKTYMTWQYALIKAWLNSSLHFFLSLTLTVLNGLWAFKYKTQKFVKQFLYFLIVPIKGKIKEMS